MSNPCGRYFEALGTAFGGGWNRFWYTPSDPYPLGVLRLLTGAMALYLHVSFSWDLIQFFGPDGLLPVDMVLQLENTNAAFSYLNYLSTPGELWTFHVLGGIAIFLFMIGLWSRITSVLATIVVLAYIHRAPMLTSQLEPILTLVMVYLCIGPSGAALSVDRWLARLRAKNATAGSPVTTEYPLSISATISLRLIQVHLAMMIAMMGMSKLMGDAWWSGLGLWWLMTRPESRLVDLTGLHKYPLIVQAWTHAVVLFELAFPVLIWQRLARPILIAVGCLVWLSIGLLTGQVTFAVMMLIGSLSYLSAETLRAACPCCCKGSARAVEARTLETVAS